MSASAKKPNIILFLTDGQRIDTLGCYGSTQVRTPHIDAFANGAARCTNAFATHTVCMPTRASIYTGRYPHRHGVWANGVPLPASVPTLPQLLMQKGYATAACGKLHLEPQQAYADKIAPILTKLPYYGFEEVHLSENYLGQEYIDAIAEKHPDLVKQARSREGMPEHCHELQWITDQAIDFIQRQAVAEKPFFCHCSFHELIPPSRPPQEYMGRHNPQDVPVPEMRVGDLEKKPPFYRQCLQGMQDDGRQPSEQDLRKLIARSYDQAEFIDQQFGRVIDAVQRAGIEKDTIIIFMTDHGLALNDHSQWRHGPFLFDPVVRIPMIWRIPGLTDHGRVVTEMIEQVDILPTLLSLAGAELPEDIQGQSRVDLLAARPGARGRESVLLQDRHSPDLILRGVAPEAVNLIGIRTRDWKLIRSVDTSDGELYSLKDDPGEFDNLWSDSGYSGIRAELETLLSDRYGPEPSNLPQRTHSW